MNKNGTGWVSAEGEKERGKEGVTKEGREKEKVGEIKIDQWNQGFSYVSL